ncbi:molybdenum cofactor biosynthesis protein C [Candidatus Epulonipiscium fishelsonii]|uniref:Molybdenum cofactor biosynthesis protein C n=1 Tax=Candidatus Epulonipiscium fishelsonii TaxID=77094 RepID=A0ACC8XA35_9FIRM|nr:molybdenum cofactor biosynthesis protein C [Epulopiscium sp. SCG-B05WGA-EpuloA1]ONI39070.1 molybdenum cofactor biosynthesis protein C [Epulopiscium sp. SCG-B11WGA-EpuloA1]
MSRFSHFDDAGNAIMVDVSDKDVTTRIAVACGSIKVNNEVIQSIKNKTAKKGDVLGVARVAGIMGVKQTSNLIPMCHPLLISKTSIDFEIDEEQNIIMVECSVKIEGKTGVEMEALNGVTTALLTIYDMCKAVDKEMIIQNIFLKEKMGGRSGYYRKQ